jgi:hypothetical protein
MVPQSRRVSGSGESRQGDIQHGRHLDSADAVHAMSRSVDDEREAIARMADERSKQWIADGVRLAAGQGNPFPEFAAAIRARYSASDVARADENEACADLCEHLGDNEIAAAIRARLKQSSSYAAEPASYCRGKSPS